MSTLSNPRVRRSLFGSPPAKRAKNQKAVISRAVRSLAETKHTTIDGPWLTGVAPATGTNIEISNIAAGSGFNTRNANIIHNTRLNIKLSCKDCGVVRVAVVCPKDPSNNLSTTGTQEDSININNYWILYDQLHVTTDLYTVINISLPLNHKTHWASSTGNDWRKNPIKVFVNKALNGASSDINGFVRLYYKDY